MKEAHQNLSGVKMSQHRKAWLIHYPKAGEKAQVPFRSRNFGILTFFFPSHKVMLLLPKTTIFIFIYQKNWTLQVRSKLESREYNQCRNYEFFNV